MTKKSCIIVLNVDIMDETGEHSSGYSQDVTKVRLSLSGVPLETGETISNYCIYMCVYGY